MPALRRLLALPRALRHGASVGAGLPPEEALVLDAPAPGLRDVLAAAGGGDLRPAAELLADTRLGARWELRSEYAAGLASFALRHPGRLDAWLREDPDDPDALLVRADLCVHRARALLAADRAGHASRERSEAAAALLRDGVPVLRAAAEAAPADPVPWRVAVDHAAGLRAPREVFDAYWEQAVARAPHHYGCHAAALRYLCDAGRDAPGEAFDFAERAAEDALPGSLLNSLPLTAAVEHLVVAGRKPDAAVTPSRIDAAIDRAAELSAHYGPGDPEAAGFRNELALLLAVRERWEESLEQFRAVGVHVRSRPWDRLGDPLREFAGFRTGARTQVASRVPFFGAPPSPSARHGGTGGDARAGTRNRPGARKRSGPREAGRRQPYVLALCAAPPAEVARAAPASGAALRLAPAGDGRLTWVEAAGGPAAGGSRQGRAGPAGEDPLTAAAESFTAGEGWPVLVLHRDGDRAGVALVREGGQQACHRWDPASRIPDFAEASRTARALASAFGVEDARPLTAVLRSNGFPAARRQEEALTALGLPPPPQEYGRTARTLEDVPGAHLLRELPAPAGPGSTAAAGGGRTPARPARPTGTHPTGTRPAGTRPPSARWWAPRAAAALVLLVAAGHAWWEWGRGGPGVLRPLLLTGAALYLSGRPAGALLGARARLAVARTAPPEAVAPGDAGADGPGRGGPDGVPGARAGDGARGPAEHDAP
ncbi:hypothetical protein ACFV1B_19040 [Streptomyces sp. NPDC059637]|uniref:hypothetical protein n=1 Tax=Streptomyces sp. NPDC059637 TaxID=3347752 RepID=UPI00367E80A9